jgi:hypothetical protein
MNPQFEVLGIGRTPMSSEEFRNKNGEAAAKSKDTRDFSESRWEDFEQRLHYMVGDINDPNLYSQLRVRLEEMEKNGSSPNHFKRLHRTRASVRRASGFVLTGKPEVIGSSVGVSEKLACAHGILGASNLGTLRGR